MTQLLHNHDSIAANKEDGRYTLCILASNGSQRSIWSVSLKQKHQILPQNSNLIIAFEENCLYKSFEGALIIVFFAASKIDPNVNYGTVKKVNWNKSHLKNSIDDSISIFDCMTHDEFGFTAKEHAWPEFLRIHTT